LDDRRRDGGTNSTLRTKEQGTLKNMMMMMMKIIS